MQKKHLEKQNGCYAITLQRYYTASFGKNGDGSDFLQSAKVPKINDDSANRSKLNKKDQNRSNRVGNNVVPGGEEEGYKVITYNS